MTPKVMKTLGFDVILEKLAECAYSRLGKQAAAKLCPETAMDRANALIEETKEAESMVRSLENDPMTAFNEVTKELKRLKSGASLNCKELLSIHLLLRASKRAAKGIRGRGEQADRLGKLAADLFYNDTLIGDIENAILGEDEVSDGASEELARIRRQMRQENETIRQKLQGMIRSKEMSKYLQDGIITMRNGRYVVPVKQEHRGQVKGLIHGESSSGQTLFIEPMSVVEANNRLSELEIKEKQEIERILWELSDQVRPYIQEIELSQRRLAYLDLVFAKGRLAVKWNAIAPEFNADGVIRIMEGRHPMIDPEKVIPVSIEMGKEVRSLIITGPNTGGKTVTLKLCGIFCMMAQCGMMIPAKPGATLPVFQKIFADIGDEQSIEQSLSTFSSHMTNIVRITREAGKGSLVLLDELGAGTDPQEGAALASAVLEALNNRGVKLMATTHYSEIKAYAMATEGFLNASMEFDADSLQPTYRLVMGVAGASNAFLISRRLGLSKQIVTRAAEFMSEERLQFDALLKEADAARRHAQTKLNKAHDSMLDAQKKQEQLERQQKALEKKQQAMLERAKKEALEIVNKAREEAEEAIAQTKKLAKQDESTRTKTIEQVRKGLNKKREKLQKSIEPARQPVNAVNPKDLKVGDQVRVVSLGVDATVSALPDQKGMVAVHAGIMNLTVPVKDLELLNRKERKQAGRNKVMLEKRSVSLELDLHGMAVDEAIIEVDKYLDDAFLSGLNEVSIIHGKGTGTLRKGIQDYLRTHPHVESFRLGKYGEGEIGVTVVTLK